MSLTKFGLDVKKIVENLIKQTNDDQIKWTGAHMITSDRVCEWRAELPEDKLHYVSYVGLRIMAVFHCLTLVIKDEVISRNQKLLSGLLKAIKNQDKRLYDDPRIQHVIAIAKKFENPE